MIIDKFNGEGYYDPTAYEAMTAIEKEGKVTHAFRPIVYICSPYAGDTESNVKAAREYSRFAVDMGYSIQHIYRLLDKAMKLIEPPSAT